MSIPIVKNPRRLFWVDPNFIEWTVRIEKNSLSIGCAAYNGLREIGVILSDKYIQRGLQFTELSEYMALERRYIHGFSWEESGYRQIYEDRLRAKRLFRLKFPTWLIYKRVKLSSWDSLLENMKKEGYKPAIRIEENIEVCIDSHGGILFADGKHRLFFARLLNIHRVPIVVTLWPASLAIGIDGIKSTEQIVEKLPWLSCSPEIY